MDRREELLTPIDTLLAAHADWTGTDNPELSRDVIDRIEDAVAVWSGGDMPGDLLDLYSKMKALDEAWTTTVLNAEDPDHIMTAKAGTFWKALDAIRQIRDRAEADETEDFRPLESVAMLTAQKVGDQQICWIYRARWADGAKTGPGLWDQKRNRPLLQLLEKERQQPGSVIPADFIPWHVAERKQAVFARQAAANRASAARQERIAKMTQPCPETLADLVGQGVSLSQIARMKKTTKAEIRKQCVAAGLPVPVEEYEAPRSDFQPDLTDADQRRDAADRPMPVKREIKPASQTTHSEPSDDFGGDPDDWQGDGEDPTERTTSDVEGDGEPQQPMTTAEKMVARWMDTGGTDAREISKAINAEGGADGETMRVGTVKEIMGRLKGDPERLQAALAE